MSVLLLPAFAACCRSYNVQFRSPRFHSPCPTQASSQVLILCLPSPRSAAGCCNTLLSWKNCSMQRSPPMLYDLEEPWHLAFSAQRSSAGFFSPACWHTLQGTHQSAASLCPGSASRMWAAGNWLQSDSFCSRYQPERQRQLLWWYSIPESATVRKSEWVMGYWKEGKLWHTLLQMKCFLVKATWLHFLLDHVGYKIKPVMQVFFRWRLVVCRR